MPFDIATIKPYLTPASILIAAMLISGAITRHQFGTVVTSNRLRRTLAYEIRRQSGDTGGENPYVPFQDDEL